MPETDRTLVGEQGPSVQVGDVDPLVGIELGGFKVTKLLAAGGMGLVYEAMHPAIGRRAAVKVLKPEVASDAEWTKRFLSEARALGSLKHRNLIEVLNFGKTPDGREFLMMEFLDGEPLDAYIRRLGQLAPAVALGIVDQILNGLAEAHKKGVVHRDLKPSNVFLLREHNGELLVKVLDFGLARQEPVALVDGAMNLPKRTDGASLLAGTPEYIAPEQAQGLKVQGTADLYAMGVMLFEMLTGQLPFEADSVTELLQKHLSERPPSLSKVMNNVPEGVEEFVDSLLLKEPEKRPQTADAARMTVQRLLKRMSQDSTAVRRAPDPVEVISKHAPTMKIDRPAHAHTDKALAAAFPEKNNRTWVAGLVLLVLLLLGGVAMTFLREKKVEPVVVPEPVAVVQPPPVVEPVKVAPPVEEPIEPLPKVEPKAKTETPKVTKKIFINREDCNPTPEWKSHLSADLKDMMKSDRVLHDSALFEVFETEGRKISTLVESASTTSDCVTASEALVRLKQKGKFPTD